MALASLLLPAVLMAGLALMVIGQPLTAPEWLRNRVEDRLDAMLDGFDVKLGKVSLVVEDNWDPRLRVRNLTVAASDNSGRVDLAQVDLRLALDGLGAGVLAPRNVRVSGMFLTVIRQADGTFNISVGDDGGAGAFGENAQLATLGRQIEGYLERPLLSHLDTVVIEDVALRYEDVRAGQGWTVDSGLLQLSRDGQAISISAQMSLLGGRDYVTNVQASVSTRFDSSATEFAMNFEDMPSDGIASQSPALAWLGIVDAPISAAMRGSTDESGALGPLSVSLKVEDGVLQPEDVLQPIPFEELSSYLTYDPARGAIRFEELALDSKRVRATASGQALLGDWRQGLPNELVVQLEFSRFEANPTELEDVPLALERSFADFRLRLDPFDLKLGQAVIREGAHRMQLSGAVRADQGQWVYAVDGYSDGLDAERLVQVWPDQLKPKLRKWIDDNILRVALRHINLAIRSRGEERPNVYLDFQFSDADMKFLRTMPPLRNLSGYASLVDNQFRVGAEGGVLTADQGGDLDVTGTGFVIEDTRVKSSMAQARIRARGSITAGASLLDREPLSVFTKANLPVDLAEGWAEVSGEVRFPVKPKVTIKEVAYAARGKLWDVRTMQFVPDKELRGNMRLFADNARVEIAGKGTLGAVPFDGRWHMRMGQENAGRSWVEGTAEMSQRTIDEFNIGLPDGSVSGRGEAEVEIKLVAQQPPRMSLRSTLEGVDLRIAPIGWRKGAERDGLLEAEITLGAQPRVDRLVLDAPGLAARGDVTLSSDGGLERLHLDAIKVGRWLEGTGELQGRGPGRAPAVEMRSGRFDLRAMPELANGSGGTGDSGPIYGRLDRVTVAEGLYLDDVALDLRTSGGISGTFSGSFKGVAPVSGTLAPHRNGTEVTIQSQQGGRIAAAMGVVKAATRGAMRLKLVPHRNAGQYDGEVTISDIKVQNVPLIAELLNAISVIGLIEQLNGPGLLFTDVFGRFRITPDRLVIAESSAVGPSLGISADGVYGFEDSRFDLQGAISPIYALNILGRPISKRGEGLIGFNYTMRGPSDAPQIMINPLSVLTPGFFREIFRRPPPKLSN